MNAIDLELTYRCRPQIASGLNIDGGLTPLPRPSSATPEPLDTRRAVFRSAGFFGTPVYRRCDLAPRGRLMGPAIVQEQPSTIVRYPGQNRMVDGYLNIEIDVGQA